MRLLGVIRVSRVGSREGESFISPTVQADQIAAYARARGHTVTGWEEDLDQPGSTLQRPGLQRALAAVKAGEADGIIAAKLDRLTRSIVDLGHLLALAGKEGWNLVVVDVGLDLGTPNGKLVAHVLGAVAEWELDRRRSDWQIARARAVARGVHIASRAPTGYQRTGDGRLEHDPAAAPVIRELFSRRASGDGWKALADFVTASGIRTPYGNETWTPAAVAKVIRNRVYLGEARSGEHVLPDAHAPIVDAAEWERAQSTRIRQAARTHDLHALAGLVRCASCRYVAKADTMRDRDKGRLGMYRCRRVHAAGECPAPIAVLARVLDPHVEEQFLGWLRADGPEAQASVANRELDEAVRELAITEADLLAYLETDALAIVGRDAFEHGLRLRRERVDAARSVVRVAHEKAPAFGALTPGELLAAWPTLDRAERRFVYGAALDAVVVWPHRSGRPIADRVTLVFRGLAPQGLPQRGRRVELAGWPDERPCDVGMAGPEDL